MIQIEREIMVRAILAKGQPLPAIAKGMGVACSTLSRIANMEAERLSAPVISKFARYMEMDYAEFVSGLRGSTESSHDEEG